MKQNTTILDINIVQYGSGVFSKRCGVAILY